jgi:uncharacterized protein
VPAGSADDPAALPGVIPVFPLDRALLLPGGLLPLQIFEPRYLNMLDDVMAGARIIGMIQTAGRGDPARPDLARVGCVGRVTRYSETQDGRYLITLTGLRRFEVAEELTVMTPYRQVRADYRAFAHDGVADEVDPQFDRELFLILLKRYLGHLGLEASWDSLADAPEAALVDSLAMALPFSRGEKQALIEAVTLADRRGVLSALMRIDAAGDAGEDDAGPPMQ